MRARFLGLFDEVLTRNEFDGLELDFCRQPSFFKSGQAFRHVSTMTDFIRKARDIVRRHQAEQGRAIKLIVRVPPSIDHTLEVGIDTEAWIRDGLVDAVVLGSLGYCAQRIDIGRAVKAAGESAVLIYTGFDAATHPTSPQGGYERHPETVLRAAALNGYQQGAVGVHLFNYGYRAHRQGPVSPQERVVALAPDKRIGRFHREEPPGSPRSGKTRRH